MSKPKLLIARAIFPDTIARLAQHFEVESNQADEVWDRAQLTVRLAGKQAMFSTGTERIDAKVLDACPALKIVSNMSVGYNNLDTAAMHARGAVSYTHLTLPTNREV